jgi:O-antigen chain-terminating methyltransferase
MPAGDKQLSELTALLTEVREKVRSRRPSSHSEIPLPDLMPVLQARDAAYGKVASIGSVNPRPGGLVNNLIQAVKRLIARSLNWLVRDQIEFNHAMVGAVEAILEAMRENNRILGEIGSLRDLHSNWNTWRTEWQQKLAANETQFLRSLADLQIAYQHRASMMESNFRDLMRAQHTDFHAALQRSNLDVQNRLWADLERIRVEYESIIHNELRLVRQRAAVAASQPVPTLSPAPASTGFDYLKFAEKFRGPETYVKQSQQRYAAFFAGCRSMLDLGCGRGEFLELMREVGIPARGIEQSAESVAICRHKGLEAAQADLFAHLDSLADASLDGIFCSQVVEHLPPERLPELIALAHRKLARGGRIAIETPNPECLAIFATHFYLDPTHTRPIPPALLAFYIEEAGFGRIEVQRFAPAIESMPSVGSLPEDFRQTFFSCLDYAVLAIRLS